MRGEEVMALLLWLGFGAACCTVGYLICWERVEEAREAAEFDLPNDDDVDAPIGYWPEPADLASLLSCDDVWALHAQHHAEQGTRCTHSEVPAERRWVR
jgi:hypothetical protein